MNGIKMATNKKLLSLVVVLVMCMAALVTVAYAYNANYKDTIDGSEVVPEENSKYIYVTGAGLNYPGEDVYATFDVNYTTTETTVDDEGNNVITTYPNSYKLVDLDDGNTPSDITMVDGTAVIKIGTVEVVNKNTKATSVTLLASNISDVLNEENSIFKNSLSTENIKFKVSGGDYSNIFDFTNNKVTVEVYLVAAVDTEPSSDKFNSDDVRYVDPETGKLYLEKDSEGKPIFEDFGTLETTLAVPGFKITLSASDDSEPITKVGTVTADEIAAVKAVAKVNDATELKVVNANGASVTLNSVAINSLADDTPVSLTVTEVSSGVPAGIDKAYEIDFSGYHFGQTGANVTVSIPYDGESTDKVSIAYIENGAVAEVYEAAVVDGKVVFTTNHLSTYGIVKAYDAVASVTIDKVTKLYADFSAAAASTTGADEALITLLKDIDAANDNVQTRDPLTTPSVKDLLFDGNGHKIILNDAYGTDMLCFNQVEAIYISSLTIVGNGSAGFYTEAKDVIIEDCSFEGTFKNDSNNWTGTDGCPVDICCQSDDFSIVYNVDPADVYVWYYPVDAVYTGVINGVETSNGMAKIGDNAYMTLAEAFSAAKSGDTITLLRDIDAEKDNVTTRDVFGSGPYLSEITFDGNEHTLTLSSTYPYDMLCFNQAGAVTVKNLALVGKDSFGLYAENPVFIIDNCRFSGTFVNDSNNYIGNNGCPVEIYLYVDNYSVTYDCDASDVFIWYATSAALSGTVNGAADSNAMAKIGDVTYLTLADAFANVKSGETVTLLRDINAAAEKVTTRDVFGSGPYVSELTFDGNGHKITLSKYSSGYPYDMLCFNQVGSIVLEDLTIVGNESAGFYAVANNVTISSCSFEGTFKNDSNNWTGTDGCPVDIYCQTEGFSIVYDIDAEDVFIWTTLASVSGTVNGTPTTLPSA